MLSGRAATGRVRDLSQRARSGLAGRFPPSSGPNCFGAVLIAAGASADPDWFQVPGDLDRQLPPDRFDEWLAAHTNPVHATKHDHQPGVVLVWRNHDGLAEHAAVTIGDGFVFSKPSQGWFSPHLVWTVQETIAASRYRGVTLNRHVMTG